MQEPFEKNIEEQIKLFQLQPSDAVWQEVEQALHAKKRRVLPFWWLSIAAIFFVGMGIAIFYFTNKQNSIEQNNNLITVTKKSTELKQNLAQAKKEYSIENNKLINKLLLENTEQLKTEQLRKPVRQNSLKTNTKSINIQANNTEDIINGLEKKKIINQLKAEPEMEEESSTIYELKNKFTKADLVIIPLLLNTDSKKIIKSNPLNKNEFAKKFSTKIAAQKQWFWNASIGIVQTKQTLFDSQKSFDNLSGALQTSQTFSNDSTTVIIPNGIALSGGIGFSKNFNRYWNYTIALQYKLLQSTQQLSKDTVNNATNNFINYYPGATTTKVNNTMHWLQIPILLQYTFNPKSSNQWMFNIGSSVAYSLYNNWLIVDKNNNSYYFNKNNNNHLFINLQTGLSFKHKQQYSIALLAEKSITPIHKQVAKKQYFTQLSLQFSKFLNTKK